MIASTAMISSRSCLIFSLLFLLFHNLIRTYVQLRTSASWSPSAWFVVGHVLPKTENVFVCSSHQRLVTVVFRRCVLINLLTYLHCHDVTSLGVRTPSRDQWPMRFSQVRWESFEVVGTSHDCCDFVLESRWKIRGMYWTLRQKFLAMPLICRRLTYVVYVMNTGDVILGSSITWESTSFDSDLDSDWTDSTTSLIW